jgi:hypothetical protein
MPDKQLLADLQQAAEIYDAGVARQLRESLPDLSISDKLAISIPAEEQPESEGE